MLRALVVTVGLLAVSARADVPPANTVGCSNKKAGDRCDTDDSKAGVCADATCTRNDYSAGPPPKQVEVPCLKCEPKQGSCSMVGLSPSVVLAGLVLRRRRGR